MRNNIRFDLSDFLIHFFRNIDLESGSYIDMPEHMGWKNLYEDSKLPAFFLLRSVITNGRIWATWSIRNNVRTIYGDRPAICFTEMPIAAFIESSRERYAQNQAMSPYALIFKKEDLFHLGARQVIYGSSSTDISARENQLGDRMLPTTILPILEQYRYVTYTLSLSKRIDWTHEREWRWALPYHEGLSEYKENIYHDGASDWEEIQGLDFNFENDIRNMGVIVQNTQEAELIIGDILMLIDSNTIPYDKFSFVLVNERLPNTIDLQRPQVINQAIQSATLNFDVFFAMPYDHIEEYNYIFSNLVQEVESSQSNPQRGEHGGCWLWFSDNKSPLVRALLRRNRIIISKDGRYLANLYEFSDMRGLAERINMTKELAKLVKEKFNVESFYFAISNSDYPDDLPYYSDFPDNNMNYYNCSWNYF